MKFFRGFFNSLPFSIILWAIIILSAQWAFGATYYMRADGTAANKEAATGPCATQANCMSIATHDADTYSAGDTIILCDDGGVYRDQMDIPSSGSSGSPITYQAETGDTPTISGADSVIGVAGDWADQGGNVWRKNIGATEPKIVNFNGSNMGVVDATPDSNYEWTYSNPNLDVYAEANPASYYSAIEAGQRDQCISIVDKDYITIDGIVLTGANAIGALKTDFASSNIIFKNSTVTRTFDGGVLINGSDYVTIDSNTIEYIAKDSDGFGIAVRSKSGDASDPADYTTISGNTVTDGLSAHGIYGSVMTNGTISGNTAYRIRLEPMAGGTISDVVIDGNTVTGRIGAGRDADGTKTVSNITISNNNVTALAEYAYSPIDTSYTTGTINIFGNTVTEPKTDSYGIAIFDYGVGGTYNIYNNLVTTVDRGIYNNGGGIMNIYNNKVVATGTGTTGDDCGFRVVTTAATTAYLYNNIFYGFYYFVSLHTESTAAYLYNNSVVFLSIGIYLYNVALSVEAQNNIFYATAPAYYILGPATPTVTADYNIYGPAVGNYYRVGGTTRSFSNHVIAGYDTHSYNTDPLFKDVSGGNLELLSTSPAINAGADLGSAYSGTLGPGSKWPNDVMVVPQGAFRQWEIGAYVHPYGGGYKQW